MRWLLNWFFQRKHTSPFQTLSNDEYVNRNTVESLILEKLSKKQSFVLYGPASQGKTTVISKLLHDYDTIYIECHPEFKLVHIYRLILSSIGYSFVTQRKTKSKSSITAKLGVLKSTIEGNNTQEFESSTQEITIDLKNPAEVAHLIMRSNRNSYVIFNNFHLLNDNTKVSLLYDLNFLLERTQIKCVIVGAWLNEDYLEIIQPNLRSLLYYIKVPFWEHHELVDAYRKWNKIESPQDDVDKLVYDLNLICQGDVSLLKYITRILQNNSTTSTSTTEEKIDALKPLVIEKLKPIIIQQLTNFLKTKDLYFSFNTVEKIYTSYPNPDYDRDEYSSSSYINPQTNKRYVDGLYVDIDKEGNASYLERESYGLVTTIAEIGTSLIRSFHSTVASSEKTSISINDLIKHIQLPEQDGISYNMKRLEDIYKNIEASQIKNQIAPLLFSHDGKTNRITINYQKFSLFLKNTSESELDDIIEDILPTTTPKPRKRNNISEPANTKSKYRTKSSRR